MKILMEEQYEFAFNIIFGEKNENNARIKKFSSKHTIKKWDRIVCIRLLVYIWWFDKKLMPTHLEYKINLFLISIHYFIVSSLLRNVFSFHFCYNQLCFHSFSIYFIDRMCVFVVFHILFISLWSNKLTFVVCIKNAQ